MRRRLQEKVFQVEVLKRIDQMIDEFDLDPFFLIGALEMIIHRMKNDIDLFYLEENIDDDN
jgi:hypothetical protein